MAASTIAMLASPNATTKVGGRPAAQRLSLIVP